MRHIRKAVALLALLTLLASPALAQRDDIKACWLYIGPVGDYGYSYAQDLGRKQTAEDHPDIDATTYVEAVAEAEVEATVDQLVRNGCNVIFGTSFGFGDGLLESADRYPDVIFAHATGVERTPNMLTYMADFYQVYYVNGLMAGAITESDTIGYVGAFPIPEVKRHINAFTLGVREVNPNAKVVVRWIYNWFDPAAAREATEALIADGADVLAYTEDSPTVPQVAGERGLASFAHYAAMTEYAPETMLSGQLVHWGVLTSDIISKIKDGTYTNTNLEDVDYFWGMAEGSVEVGAEPGMVVHPNYEERLKEYMVETGEGTTSVYDLVLRRIDQLNADPVEFEPFAGPVSDRKGNQVYAEGENPTVLELLSMQWAAPGVDGPWEGEP